MIKLTRDELNKILENHKHFLKEDIYNWQSMRADLTGANLTEANLSWANLSRANLSEANLTVVDLTGANLTRANLIEANLTGAYLSEANLTRANLSGAENIPYIPMICPEEGSFIAYKKVRSNIILKLLIPKDAKRCSGLSRKCRCNKAIVLEMQNYNGESIDVKEAYSIFDKSFKYRIGETVEVSDFDEDRWNECSTGIHFFINRQEAIEYR